MNTNQQYLEHHLDGWITNHLDHLNDRTRERFRQYALKGYNRNIRKKDNWPDLYDAWLIIANGGRI